MVWSLACLFSDKFKFEGDYVPVSPIVWVYIDQVLLKPAELYIPHHINLSRMNKAQIREQLFLLTASESKANFQKNSEFHVEISQVAKIVSSRFCLNCIATHGNNYKAIPKRYLMARADKKESEKRLLVWFFILYFQPGCKKTVLEQCAKEGFTIINFKEVTFAAAADARVSHSFHPPDETFNGWTRSYVGFYDEYILEKRIDYYKAMGCDGGVVTEEGHEQLKMLQEDHSYPPQFRLQFEVDDHSSEYCSSHVVITFDGLDPPVKRSTIHLDGPSRNLPVSPSHTEQSLSLLSTDIHVNELSEATDPGLGDVLQVTATSHQLKEKWFCFGMKLNLTIGQLQEIEASCSDREQCTRMVVLQWRVKNKTESWEPLALALTEVGLQDLAHEMTNMMIC